MDQNNDNQNNNNTAKTDNKRKFEEKELTPEQLTGLSKKLSYLLRHSQGLVPVYTDKRWVPVDIILQLPGMKRFSRKHITNCIQQSISTMTKQPRFQELYFKGQQFIRVDVGNDKIKPSQVFDELSTVDIERKVEPVPSLFQSCLSCIGKNIKLYGELEGIGDSFLLESLIQEMIRQKKLNNANLKLFLVSDLERLTIDPKEFVVEQSTFRKIANSCSGLAYLKIFDTPVLTDTVLAMISKKCKSLKTLELKDSKYITDNGLKSLAKNAKENIRSIDLTNLSQITIHGIQAIVTQCKHLDTLSIYECAEIPSVQIAELNEKKPEKLKINYMIDSSQVSDLFVDFEVSKKKWKKEDKDE